MLWVGFGLLLVEFGLVWGRLDLGLAPCGFPLDRIRLDLGSLGFGFVLGLLWVGFGWVGFALGWLRFGVQSVCFGLETSLAWVGFGTKTTLQDEIWSKSVFLTSARQLS